MTKRQKTIIYAIALFFVYHSFRDYFQTAGLHLGFFTDLRHNYAPSLRQQLYRSYFQTTFFEAIILGGAGIVIGRNKFGILGIWMVIATIAFFLGWLYGYTMG